MQTLGRIDLLFTRGAVRLCEQDGFASKDLLLSLLLMGGLQHEYNVITQNQLIYHRLYLQKWASTRPVSALGASKVFSVHYKVYRNNWIHCVYKVLIRIHMFHRWKCSLFVLQKQMHDEIICFSDSLSQCQKHHGTRVFNFHLFVWTMLTETLGLLHILK